MALVTRQKFLFFLLIMAMICTYATYTPADDEYFWIYWATVVVLLFFGFLVDLLFCNQFSFFYDPNFSNWQRKLDHAF